jgi:hypothetical protein
MDGNCYDYGFRIYNPALGRFLSVDPLTKSFSHLTPYQFASNSPIAGRDLDGLEFVLSIYDPEIGNQLVSMMQAGKGIYEIRKFLADAIHSKFSDQELNDKLLFASKPNDDGVNTYVKHKPNPLTGMYNKADLIYDETAPSGLTINYNVFQGYGDDGTYKVWGKTMGPINYVDNKAYPDMGMPIDLRMIESPKFGNTYKDDDFLGSYQSTTTTLQGGPTVGGNSGTTKIDGVLKGYGYVSYSSEGVGPSFGSPSWGISTASGLITGKGTPGNTFTPETLAGWGTQIATSFSISGIGFEKGKWSSYNTFEDAQKNNNKLATFSGKFSGIVISLGLGGKSAAGGSVSKQTTNTTQTKVTVTYCTEECQ